MKEEHNALNRQTATKSSSVTRIVYASQVAFKSLFSMIHNVSSGHRSSKGCNINQLACFLQSPWNLVNFIKVSSKWNNRTGGWKVCIDHLYKAPQQKVSCEHEEVVILWTWRSSNYKYLKKKKGLSAIIHCYNKDTASGQEGRSHMGWQ